LFAFQQGHTFANKRQKRCSSETAWNKRNLREVHRESVGDSRSAAVKSHFTCKKEMQ